MPLYTGQHGVVKHAADPRGGNRPGWDGANQVKNWQVNIQSPMIETTTLGQSWAERIPGVRSATGTCEINYYRGPNNTGSTATDWLDRIVNHQSADDDYYPVQFLLNRGSASNGIEIRAFITNITVTCSVGEVVTLQATFESDGPIPAMNL